MSSVRLGLVTSVGLLLGSGFVVHAQEPFVAEAPSRYCGLFCVYAAAKQRGLDVEFESLVDPDLLTGRFGSSVGNVIDALGRCGMEGYPRAGMTLEQLSTVTKPVLLHVATPTMGHSHRHWVLYLGRDQSGQIHIYDPPRSHGSLSPAELLSVWDGIAVLTEEPSLQSKVPNAGFLVLGVLVIAVTLFAGRWLSSWKLLGLLVLVSSVVVAVFPETGVLRSPVAVGGVQARFFKTKFPEIGFAELESRMKQPHVIVDARPTDAFAYGHIPGAINVPVNGGFVRFSTAAQSLQDNLPVVVYCQSDRCAWGDEVACQLQARGVTNIEVYRGGMNDWHSRRQQRTE